MPRDSIDGGDRDDWPETEGGYARVASELSPRLENIRRLFLDAPIRKELHPEAQELARRIDHTYLTIDPDDRVNDETVAQICREAVEYGFASVCVRPAKVALARQLLLHWGAPDVAVCAVIDFPKQKGEIAGKSSPEEKAAEARQAQESGATEFDVVIDYESILHGDRDRAYRGIAAVAHAVKERDAGAIVKAILETARLQKNGGAFAIDDACRAAIEGRADFLKTSSGFAEEGGATADMVEHLVEYARPCGALVKASGGIRTRADAERMIAAGADRIGTSSGVKIVEEKREYMIGNTGK